MEKRIITISREFGSGGRFIGEEAAKKLGIAYYDKNIINEIAEKSGLSPEYVQESAELSPKKGLFAYALAGRDITGKSVEEVIKIRQEENKTLGTQVDEVGKLDEFKQEILEQKKEILQERVADGRLTQEQADEILLNLETNQANCDGTGLGRGMMNGLGFGQGMMNGYRNGNGNGFGNGMMNGYRNGTGGN